MLTGNPSFLQAFSSGVLALSLFFLGTGCNDNAQPIVRPIIEAKRVRSISADALKQRACFDQPAIIEQCLAELNRLDYKPIRARQEAGPDATITLKDESGAVIVEYGLFRDEFGSISVKVPPSEVSYIAFERMPTVEKAISYAVFDTEREILERMASDEEWDRAAKGQVQDGVKRIRLYCPAASMAVPGSPEELRQSLERVKGISANDIDKFVPFYDVQ